MKLGAGAVVLWVLSVCGWAAAQGAGDAFAVSVRVDAAAESGTLTPIWRFFGADEPNYAYMEHGEKLVKSLGEMDPGNVYFRAHNMLNTGDGTASLKWGSTGAYVEDDEGRPVYDWTIVDRIFDTYLAHGVRPYAEIGFMPEALSVKPEPYRHQWDPSLAYEEIYTGWAYPPADYEKWAELVYQWVRHSVERYGRDEVAQWYWQTWNEPNIAYWQGTFEEFLKLNDYAIDAVRRALPEARVGGADTAGSGGSFSRRFFEHCLRGTNYATGETGTPLDFVSFHAKGSPQTMDGHVRMGIAQQLRTIDDGFEIVASFPELKDTPIVIGESDPEGCAACQGPQLAYRNGTMYSSYTAASFARKRMLAERHDVNLAGALTWAFMFEDTPFFAGFRALATNGIDKPVLNVFRMMARMKGASLEAESDGQLGLDEMMRNGVRRDPDVGVVASREENKIWALVWHYHDDDVAGPDAEVAVEIGNLPQDATALRLRHFRVDKEHSNAYQVWLGMDSPQRPSAEQIATLESAGQLAELAAPSNLTAEEGKATVSFVLPRQGVSLLELSWD